MTGRTPLPPGLARTERLTTRVRPAAAERFRKVVADKKMLEADAIREALDEWTRRHTT
jgi:hypothetical protein